MASRAKGTIPHLPALDGLRGLALAGVLLFHAGGALRGGYLGVDLFFVLSGYLITSLLLGEKAATGRIALGPFWIRRARRLFPALLALMPAIALYGRFIATPGELAGLRSDALATLAYVANWRAIFAHRSYWQLFTSPSPLEHTWSLAIEEQFYVVWPLVVTLVLRKRGARTLLALTLGLCALSMGAMLFFYDPEKTSRAYLGTDTRAASILAGAALACVMPPTTAFSARAVRWLDLLGGMAVAVLALAWLRLEGASWALYHGGFWVTELAVLVLVACAVAGSRSWVARALSLRPLTYLGTISYGVYLWHWPVDVVLDEQRLGLHGFWLHAAQLGVTLGISLVSYRLVERPIRAGGLPFGRPVYVVPASVALAVLLVVRGTHARELPASALPPAAIAPDPGRDTFRVLLVGDSTANSFGWGLRELRQLGTAVDLHGRDGCTMLADTCAGETWADLTRDLKPSATIVMLGGAFLHGTSVDGEWRKACHPTWDEKFERHLAARLGDLVGGGVRVFAATTPYPLGPYDTADFRKETDCINASIQRSVARVPGASVLDLNEHMCPAGVCVRSYHGLTIRPDGVHYRIDSTAEIAAWLLAQARR
ncbi:MAG: Lipopolysaccharide modification acyltransferase [Labilithrix sp.]|nr:Lipopolysaccharide modification acyltransferase [Labilithrix sp.]